MSSGIASKNLYDLLGNDPDQDPDREQPPPIEAIDKASDRRGKRNATGEAPSKGVPGVQRGGGRGGRGGRRDNMTGSEAAFNDTSAGRDANRSRPVDDGLREDRHSNRLQGGRIQRGPPFDGRGGRGGAGGRGGRGGKDDRHSRSIGAGPYDRAKQAAHGWGEETGQGEWNDEVAGAAIAVQEEKQGLDANVGPPVNAEGETPVADSAAPAAEPEPEDKTKSYDAYLAEQAEKRLALSEPLPVRKANEGSDSKLPEGKEFQRETGEYFMGTGGKASRQRERKEKNILALEHDIQARERESGRGGRGGSGGGRGRARGEGGFRGEGRGRGGGRGRGERGDRSERGEFRGSARGRGGSSPNVTDTSAFPSLGS